MIAVYLRFLRAEIRYSGKQSIIFILCVALSIMTLTALNSFKRDVHSNLLGESRNLHGGDIIISSSGPFREAQLAEITQLAGRENIPLLKTNEFYSVIRPEEQTSPLLVQIKSVEPGYPFYGTVRLASGKELDDVLGPGKIVVAAEVLTRLGVHPGERLKVGSSTLEIADVVEYESARPVSFLSLGPRVFVSSEDLGVLNLLSQGSRAQYRILLKIDDRDAVESIRARIEEGVMEEDGVRVETASSAPSRIKRFFDNLLFFLSFISIFTLLLSGIGIQSTLSGIIRQKTRSIGVIKALGGTSRFLMVNYLSLALVLGIAGSFAGLVAAMLVKLYFPVLFHGLVPVGTGTALASVDIAEGLLLGVCVVCIFTFLPLYRLGNVKPAAIFRVENSVTVRDRTHRRVGYAVIGGGVVFFFLLVLNQLRDFKTGLFFMLGILVLALFVGGCSVAVLKVLKKSRISDLSLRQAVKSLFRPGNNTKAIMGTLAAAFSILLAIYLVKLNLFSSYIESYPEKAPNLFCIDIQSDQVGMFRSVVGSEAPLYPLVRARLLSINSEPIDREKERLRKSDNLGRHFNLTYRNELLDDEIVTDGSGLFTGIVLPENVVEVSVLDTIAEIGEMEIGDRLTFNIQGITLDAQITSIRSRIKSKLYPFFYFVFKPGVLEDAPKTFFSAIHRPRGEIPGLIADIVEKMPNISTINVSDMAMQLGRLFGRLSMIISFFASFSIAAGLLIMVSTVLATKPDRIREISYFKVLGADRGFILKTAAYEAGILSLVSGIISAGTGCLVSFIVCRQVFDLPFAFHLPEVAAAVGAAILAVWMITMASVLGVVGQKPILFLRQQDGV